MNYHEHRRNKSKMSATLESHLFQERKENGKKVRVEVHIYFCGGKLLKTRST